MFNASYFLSRHWDAEFFIGSPDIGGTTTVSTVVVLATTARSIGVGRTATLTATVTDIDGAPAIGSAVTFVSSNETYIASPASGITDSNGEATATITGLAVGTTAITATCDGIDSAPIVFAVTTTQDKVRMVGELIEFDARVRGVSWE